MSKQSKTWIILFIIIALITMLVFLLLPNTSSSLKVDNLIKTDEDLLAQVPVIVMNRPIDITDKSLMTIAKHHLTDSLAKGDTVLLDENPLTNEDQPETTTLLNMDFSKIEWYADKNILKVIIGNEYQVYSMDASIAKHYSMMKALSSFYLPSAIGNTFLNSTASSQESVNDVPTVTDYLSFQVDNLTFYIYEDAKTYYLESPYMFIRELDEETYLNAIDYLK